MYMYLLVQILLIDINLLLVYTYIYSSIHTYMHMLIALQFDIEEQFVTDYCATKNTMHKKNITVINSANNPKPAVPGYRQRFTNVAKIKMVRLL